MMPVTTFIRKAFTENIGLKTVSLITAILIWAFIMSAKEISTWTEVKLSYKIPEDKALVADVPTKMRVLVKGPWTALSTLNTDNLVYEVDLMNNPLGQSVVYLSAAQLRLPPGLRIANVTPAQIEVYFERKLHKTVEIIPQLTGTPKPGYKLSEPSATVDPPNIVVEGPESEVALLQAVQAVPVDVTDKDASFDATTDLIRVSPRVIFVDVKKVSVSVKIEPDILTKEVSDVPVIINGGSETLFAQPDAVTITVKGLRPRIERILPEHLIVTIDATNGPGTYEASVTPPKDVTVTRVFPHLIKVVAPQEIP